MGLVCETPAPRPANRPGIGNALEMAGSNGPVILSRRRSRADSISYVYSLQNLLSCYFRFIFNQGDVGGAGSSAKSPVQRRQRQFAPRGNFEIRGVIDREFVLAGQIEQRGFVMAAVH